MTNPAIDLLELIGTDTRLKKAANVNGRGPEYHGACPFCGGKDRFAVQPQMGQWWCRQCSPSEHWQSAADYVMRRDNVDFKAAMKTLGLAPPDPETWDYHDEHGTVIYQVVRYIKNGEKSYYQRTPDGRGDWRKGLNGVAPTIYHLPEVLQAAKNGDTIYVCEGEKCADAVRRLGLVATTNSGGAKKWRGSFSAHLRGAGDVVIFADNDDKGREHADEVLKATRLIVPSVRVVEFSDLPPAGDVADWLALGHTKAQLLERCAIMQIIEQRDAPPAKSIGKVEYVVADWRTQGVTLAQLQHKQFDPERWVIENILPEGACLLAAKYKSKKSWMSLALGISVAMGGKALGRLNVSPGRVLYLDLEGKQQRIQKRTRSMLGVQHIDWPDNFHIFEKWPQGDEGLRELENWFASYPDTALVIIDVLASFRRPMEKHEEIYRYDRDTVDPLNGLFERHHASGLLVHHFNKAKHDDIMDSITGSTGLPSAVNTMWGLTRDVNDSAITILHLRGRDIENDEPLALKWDTYLNMHIIEGPALEVATSAERKAILQLLGDDTPRTPKEIAAELSKSVETVKQLLRKLLNDGLIDKPAYGQYALVRKRDHSDHSDHSGTSDHDDTSIKSDRSIARVIPPDHSVLAQPSAPNGKSDRSDRDLIGDLSIDCAMVGNREVWRLWDDITNTILSEHTTEADAQTEARRRKG